MPSTKLYKLTGILLIVLAVGFNLFFTLLAMNFEYPDILRSPTGYVLEQYHAAVWLILAGIFLLRAKME